MLGCLSNDKGWQQAATWAIVEDWRFPFCNSIEPMKPGSDGGRELAGGRETAIQ